MSNQASVALASAIAAVKVADHFRQDSAADRVAAILDAWYVAIVRACTLRHGLELKLKRIYYEHGQKLVDAYLSEMEGLVADGHERVADAIVGALSDKAKLQLIAAYSAGAVGGTPLTEATAPPPLMPAGGFPGQPPRPLPRLGIPVVDLAKLSQLTRKEIDRLMRQVVFPAMSRKQVQTILFQQQALNRIAPITSLVTPSRLVSVITQAQSKGLSRADIARKELFPLFQTTKADAKRVARTTGALIATERDMTAFQGLGDLLAGYQVHCVTDRASRPWHQARKGEEYFINPKPGQKGLSACPKPPYEPPDPNERPPGTPEIAHNCRCFLSPVIRKS